MLSNKKLKSRFNFKHILLSCVISIDDTSATRHGTSQGIFGFVRPMTLPSSPFDQKRYLKLRLSSRSKEEVEEKTQQESLSSLTAKLNKIVAIRMREEEGETSTSPTDDDTAKDEEEELIRLQLLYTRLKDLQLNRTYVGPSTIPNAGRGLFCSRDTFKGEPLTCYPGDALVLLPEDDDEKKTRIDEWTVLLGEHVPTNDPRICDMHSNGRDVTMESWFLQNLIHAHGASIGIVGLPFMDKDTAYLGHFCNDGVSPHEVPTNAKECEQYVISSNQKANAVQQDVAEESHMVTIATRDIKEGEEIFVTYGPDYWMSQQKDFS